MAVMTPAPPTDGRHIAGDGTSESLWQSWRWLTRCPRRPLDLWVGAKNRLVVVAPHPDDEIIAFGALLHQHARRGGAIVVVAVTDGEASHPATAQRSASGFAALRRQERLEGLRQLGLHDPNVMRLGIADGQVQRATAQLTDWLVDLLAPGDVLVTTWHEDGHPDHEACGRGSAAAGAATGCRTVQAPVWLWHWSVPGDPSVPWKRLQAFPVPAESHARKQSALAAHQSQLEAVGDATPILGQAIQKRVARAMEYFFV